MKQGNGKIIALAALAIATLSLTIGFATYTQTLNIQETSFDVTPENTFTPNVKYVSASPVTVNTVGNATVTSPGTIDTERVLWSGIQIGLTAPGDAVTLKATVENKSTFIAYLKSITTGSNKITCAAKTGEGVNSATQNIDEACSGIKVTVTAGSDATNKMEVTSAAVGNVSLTNHSLAATSGTEDITLKVEYLDGSAVTDGDFVVTIPMISLTYKSAD